MGRTEGEEGPEVKERLTPEVKHRRALVKKAQRGDPRPLRSWWWGEQEYLYRMAYLQVRSEADALDVVQETILKAYKSRKTLRGPGPVPQLADKDPHKRRPWTCSAGESPRSLWRRTWKPPPPRGLSPEERMDLYQALEDLSEPYRGLVKLKYLDGYTIREISESTGMPAGTVSVYLRRAMDKLRASLKEGAV